MDGPLEATPAPGKDDSELRRGLRVNTNTRATQVWTARRSWEDTDPAPGMAWEANSGLNWDEKYQAWVAGLERTAGTSYYDTFVVTTPWGTSIPSPHLECAELSMFLRISFAAWYELPFFMEAVDRHGARIFFGHNGIRTKNGRYANTPHFGSRYRDYTGEWQPGDDWPRDASLRRRKLWGGDDWQPVLGEGVHFGTYADEIHLNKRAGYFLMLTISYLGSVNLADSANTYHIVPEAVRAGDVLVHRWQRRGIGHTLVVKDVVETGEGTRDVTVLSGSMPRRQGTWENGVASKQYFTSAHGGGPGTAADGTDYARLGGGLRRYRVTKNVGGYWTNTWMRSDEAAWINSTDYDRIAARPALFDQMLGQVSPAEIRDALVAQIDDARRHLARYPASCAARERRENAMRQLEAVMEREFGLSSSEVDARYRILDDYVFAQLVYGESKTCCWNRSTAAMYAIIMDRARAEQADAAARGECVAPTVFMNDGGYDAWRSYADATGRGGQWMPWTEDETCGQRDVARDRVDELPGITPYCDLGAAGGGDPGCGDGLEPNDAAASAAVIAAADSHALVVCDGDEDWFEVAGGGRVVIEFTHRDGDLDMATYDRDGGRLDVSQSVDDRESLVAPPGARVRVYGYRGATGAYTLRVE